MKWINAGAMLLLFAVAFLFTIAFGEAFRRVDILEKTMVVLTEKMDTLEQSRKVCHCDGPETCSCPSGECHCASCQRNRTFDGKNVTGKTVILLDGKPCRWEDLPEGGTLLELVINDKDEIDKIVLTSKKK